MKNKGMTLLEATREWVRGFNAIPTQMIEKLWRADPDDWQEVTNPEMEVDYYYGELPMWGTMWSFGESLDNYWLERGGIEFFKSEEFGYFFGIDGAGYDFYEAHWIPLYNNRGLKWHDPETDGENY